MFEFVVKTSEVNGFEIILITVVARSNYTNKGLLVRVFAEIETKLEGVIIINLISGHNESKTKCDVCLEISIAMK